MVGERFNPQTHEAAAGRLLGFWGQADAHNELQDSQDHTMRPCLKQNKIRRKGPLWRPLYLRRANRPLRLCAKDQGNRVH